jgi:hypothetical protein
MTPAVVAEEERPDGGAVNDQQQSRDPATLAEYGPSNHVWTWFGLLKFPPRLFLYSFKLISLFLILQRATSRKPSSSLEADSISNVSGHFNERTNISRPWWNNFLLFWESRVARKPASFWVPFVFTTTIVFFSLKAVESRYDAF